MEFPSESDLPDDYCTMKALILSDIHGSALHVKQAVSFFEKWNADKIFILGDILYHGPRNILPEKYGPMGVVDILSGYKDCIVAVRGNCDADVDLMVLNFKIHENYFIYPDKNRNLFLSHGHIYDSDIFPLNFENPETKIDAYLFGHTHIYTLETNRQNILLCNPGSVSLPKGTGIKTFGFYDSDKETPTFSIHKLESGETLLEKTINKV